MTEMKKKKGRGHRLRRVSRLCRRYRRIAFNCRRKGELLVRFDECLDLLDGGKRGERTSRGRRISRHLTRKTIEESEDGACGQRVGLVETRGMVRKIHSIEHTHIRTCGHRCFISNERNPSARRVIVCAEVMGEKMLEREE